MKRNQVFIRAKAGERWVSADALDLTEESFRVFVLDRLGEHVFKLLDDIVEGDHIEYEVKPELIKQYQDEKDS